MTEPGRRRGDDGVVSPALRSVARRRPPCFTVRMAAMIGLLMAICVATAPAALADAAGPTDYNTVIVSIVPATPTVHIEMIGGDSFISLEQLEPVEVLVVGYQGEPYLRFDPDRTVYENRRSPSAWLNQQRYGDTEPPAFASATAPPDWQRVASDGRYTWHDHRTHWMNPKRPPGAEAGDQVLEATVPLRIDGQTVTVTVASYLLADPSPWPMVIGAVIGSAASVAVWRSDRLCGIATGSAVGAAAAILGVIAFRSVPAETQPSPLLWLLPAIALVALGLVALVRNRLATTVYLDGLAVVAGAAIAAWGFDRSDALQKALIPSDAPAGLDRAVILIALVAGAAVALKGIAGLLRPRRLEVAP